MPCRDNPLRLDAAVREPTRLLRRNALVFDLDGTLVHSLPDIRVALNAVLARDGGRPLDDREVALMVGDGVETLVRRGMAAALPGLFPGRDPDEAVLRERVDRFISCYEAAPAVLTRCWPRVEEVLPALSAAGHRLGICTNKPHAAALAMLDQLGLARHFPAVIGQGATPWIKPDPRPLLATLAALGAQPDQAVMIGDSVNDVAVARNAGIPVVLVSFGYTGTPARALGADAVIDDFADLPAALAQIR